MSRLYKCLCRPEKGIWSAGTRATAVYALFKKGASNQT